MLDVISMIFFIFLSYKIINPIMSLGTLAIGLVGIVHHYFIKNYYLLLLDVITISIGFSIFTYYSKIDKNVKPYLYFIEGSVILFFIYCGIFNLRLTSQTIVMPISLIWLPNLFFIIKYLTPLSIWLIILSIFVYLASMCVCNNNYNHLLWPFFHVLCALVIYKVFIDLHLVH